MKETNIVSYIGRAYERAAEAKRNFVGAGIGDNLPERTKGIRIKIMWIILTAKLPTAPSPPKLSIFWSIPWPNKKFVKDIRERVADEPMSSDYNWFDYQDLRDADEWEGARQIRYKNKELRVFPREFNPTTTESMELYINEGAHTLVPESPAEEIIIKRALKKGEREIYEAAIIDGATEAQAMATALRQDITLPDWKFPPIGWYKPNPEMAVYFCRSWEMK